MKRGFLRGYIALTMVIVLLFVMITIGVSATFGSVSKIQVSESSYKASSKLTDIESCVEESLLKLNTDESIPASISIGDDIFCTLELEEQTITEYTYTVSMDSMVIRVIALRSDQVYISKWEI